MEEITQSSLFGEDAVGVKDGEEAAAEDQKEAADANKPEQKAATEGSLRYLRQVMKVDGLGLRIMKLIDVRSIQKQVTKLVQLLLADEDDLQREDRVIVDSALGLWAQLVKGEEGDEDKLDIDKELVLQGLLKAKTFTIRDSFRTHFEDLVAGSNAVGEQVLNILLDQLHTLDELEDLKGKRGQRTREYFALLAKLISSVAAKKPEMLIEILKVAIKKSQSHETTEQSGEQYAVDSTRVGLLKMISTVLSLAKEDEERRKAVLEVIQETKLIDHIHHDCLFYHAGGQSSQKK